VADGIPKGVRIIIGIMLMAAFVLISWSVLTRFAGGWGVPYFSFETDRGTPCTNNLTGYVCHQMTVPDIEFYGDVVLPSDTRVIDSTYRSTHDYQLSTQLLVPRTSEGPALAGLHESFGPCVRDHPAPMPTAGLTALCVLANDDATITRDADTSSRIYTVGTGLRQDGSRVIAMFVRSR
jgi:hypothetical protein